MILAIVSFLLNVTSVLFVVYKSVNHISQKSALSQQHVSYLVSAWISFLALTSLKCSCAGSLGSLWNLLLSAVTVFCLLNTRTVNKKLFEENTLETIVAFGRGLVEKYVPKRKAE